MSPHSLDSNVPLYIRLERALNELQQAMESVSNDPFILTKKEDRNLLGVVIFSIKLKTLEQANDELLAQLDGSMGLIEKELDRRFKKTITDYCTLIKTLETLTLDEDE